MSDTPQEPAAVEVEEISLPSEFAKSLQSLLALADSKTVPTGILLRSPFTYESFVHYDGGIGCHQISQRGWEQHYYDLQNGIGRDAPPAAILPALTVLLGRAKESAARQVTPIALANVLYNAPNRRFADELMRARNAGEPIRTPADAPSVLEERRGFFASALLPHVFDSFTLLPAVHKGRRIKFTLDRSMYICNDSSVPQSIEIDFADGRGFISVAFDQIIDVDYADDGEKPIRLNTTFPDRTLEASFVFVVSSAPVVLLPDDTWNLQATIPYMDVLASGTAWVLLGSENGVKHTGLLRPVMVADGFPGHDYDFLFESLNEQGLLTTILASGYDVVILTYRDGSDYIQRNAFLAIACIERIIQNRSGNERLVVGGASMGGVVVRYALVYMERHNLDHQARAFMSFDSPQQGAIVPPSVQWFLWALKAAGQNVPPELLDQLSSPAARQMLYYSIDRYTVDQHTLSPDPLHKQLYQELREFGYPAKTRNIGISDGAGNGHQVVPNNAKTMDLSEFRVLAETWALPAGPALRSLSRLDIFFDRDRHILVGGTTNYCGAPGGQNDFNGKLAEEVKKRGHFVNHQYDWSCFIPTVSALDIPATNPYTPVAETGAPSRFGAYFVSTTNHKHVEVTLEIKAFLMKELTGHYQPPPLQMILVDSKARLHAAASSQAVHWYGPTDPLFDGWQTRLAPALTATDAALYVALTGTNGMLHIATSTDGVTWANPGEPLTRLPVNVAPALTSMGQSLYLAQTTQNQELFLFVSSDGGINWLLRGGEILHGFRLRMTPALVAVGSTLFMILPGLDQRVYATLSTDDGFTWKKYIPGHFILDGFKLKAAPAIAAAGQRLYLALPGLDNRLHFATSTDGIDWRLLGDLKGWEVQSTPSLATVGDTLYLAFNGRPNPGEKAGLPRPGLDKRLCFTRSTDGVHWAHPQPPLFDGFQTPFAPAITGFAPTAAACEP